MTDYTERMLEAYIACALWTSTDESDESGGEPLDRNYTREDVAAVSVDAMRADCRAFADSFAAHMPDVKGESDPAQVGHDFWLTRNGHGTGFWDRGDDDYPEYARDWLTDQAKAHGEAYLYIGDDGLLYV